MIMKKRVALLVAALAVTGMTAMPVQAADHYISGNAGFSWMNDVHDAPENGYDINPDAGYILTGGIGCDYGNYRLEAELGWMQNAVDEVDGIDSGDVNVISLMANGYYDFDMYGVMPFITAGIGAAQVQFDDLLDDDVNEGAFAYQIGAGVGFEVADNMTIDARYRYFATTEFLEDTTLGSHTALLGLRVGF